MCLMQFLYAEAWGGKKFLECKDCPIKCPNYEPKDEPQYHADVECNYKDCDNCGHKEYCPQRKTEQTGREGE